MGAFDVGVSEQNLTEGEKLFRKLNNPKPKTVAPPTPSPHGDGPQTFNEALAHILSSTGPQDKQGKGVSSVKKSDPNNLFDKLSRNQK